MSLIASSYRCIINIGACSIRNSYGGQTKFRSMALSPSQEFMQILVPMALISCC